MIANLKDVMRSAGYPATEGVDWTAGDTKTFQGFAVHELSVPFSQTSAMLAHPQAFPAALARIEALSGNLPEAAAAPIASPLMAEAVHETLAEAPIEHPAAAPVDAIDVSPSGQLPKQNLEMPPAPAPAPEPEVKDAADTAEEVNEEGPDEGVNEEGADEATDTTAEGDAADAADKE